MAQNGKKIALSIIIANYNRKEWLKLCLKALERQNSELLCETEVIVVDDGSTDGACEMIKTYNELPNFIYLFQQNKGPASARNSGIKKARADYVAFIDNDSIVFDDWLEMIFRNRNKISDKIVGINGDSQPFPETTNDLSTVLGKYLYGPDNWGVSNNLIYKKEIILRFGMFDESFPYPACEDFDLAYRIKKTGLDLIYCPDIRIYHPHETNWSVFKRKWIIHGYSFRHFCAKNIKKYPASIIYFFIKEISDFFIYLLIAPYIITMRRYSKEYIYFFRAYYTLYGMLLQQQKSQTKDIK